MEIIIYECLSIILIIADIKDYEKSYFLPADAPALKSAETAISKMIFIINYTEIKEFESNK